MLIGDCRRPDLLDQSEIWRYRSILFVTSDDRVNIEAAFEARLRNPSARLVVRSGKSNLNELLKAELGNYVAFEPKELSASAFALAAFGKHMPASFELEGNLARVYRQRLTQADEWTGKQIGGLNANWRRILTYYNQHDTLDHLFFHWNPEDQLQAGDTVVWIETTSSERHNTKVKKSVIVLIYKLYEVSARRFQNLRANGLRSLRRSVLDQFQRLVLLCGITLFAFLMLGSILFYSYGPQITLTDAFFATACLLIGGYPDLLGSHFQFKLAMPLWLRLFGLILAVSGTIFVGALYALMTQSLIKTRIRFFRRPVIPDKNHAVVIGLGPFGERLTRRLQQLGVRIVGVGVHEEAVETIDGIAKLTRQKGTINELLEQANAHTAKSIMAVTNDEMENLEIALMTQPINPLAVIVVRTYNPRFSPINDMGADLFQFFAPGDVRRFIKTSGNLYQHGDLFATFRGLHECFYDRRVTRCSVNRQFYGKHFGIIGRMLKKSQNR